MVEQRTEVLDAVRKACMTDALAVKTFLQHQVSLSCSLDVTDAQSSCMQDVLVLDGGDEMAAIRAKYPSRHPFLRHLNCSCRGSAVCYCGKTFAFQINVSGINAVTNYLHHEF